MKIAIKIILLTLIIIFFSYDLALAYRGEIFVIQMTDKDFVPGNIEIKRGQAVAFENLGNTI